MKALDWQNFLELQRKQHGKTLFRVAELANVAGRDSHALNVELDRLVKKGVFTRYAAGIYGMSDGVNPQQLVSVLDDGAYITGMYALYHHNLITQTPTEITCFTNRRHNRSRQRATPLGRIVFACVSPKIYRKPANGVFAPPEQALCDFVHLARRRGLNPVSLVTFRNLNKISKKQLSTILKRYPRSVAQSLKQTLLDSGTRKH
jgi:hypothetical protein